MKELFRWVVKTAHFFLGSPTFFGGIQRLLRRVSIRHAFTFGWLIQSAFVERKDLHVFFGGGTLRFSKEIFLHVNPECWAAQFFCLTGFYEPWLSRAILRRSKGTLVDVGANFGYYGGIFLGKPDTKVLFVEPSRKYVNLIKKNFQSFEGRFQIYEGGISDYNGKGYLDTKGYETMHNQVAKEAPPMGYEIDVLRLSELLEKHRIVHVDVLKLDCEGHDLTILNDSMDLFKEKRVKSLFWETSENQLEESKFEETLRQYGYRELQIVGCSAFEL